MPFLIQGSSASISPMNQEWRDVILGTNIQGKIIYYDKKEVILNFDSCPFNLYQQWENAIVAASGGSLVTMTILNPDVLNYVAVSGVFATIEKRPSAQAGVAIGPWSVRLTEVAS